MKQLKYDNLFAKKLENILKTKEVKSLAGLAFSEKVDSSILYPTDDYFLTEFQFQSIVKLLSQNDKLYVMQMGANDDLDSLEHEIYELSYPYSYTDYRSLDFYSISIIFSSQCDWIIIIDESLNGGIGLFVGDVAKVSFFETVYAKTKSDICHMVKFFIDDSKRNKNAIPYMKRIINLVLR